MTDHQDGTATIDIFDDISWYGVNEKTFKNELDNLQGNEVTVRINSYGGDVFAGHSIYNMLKQSDKHIKVVVNGIAASIASVIAMAGDEIEMPVNGMLMIHNPSSIERGTAEDMRKQADVLDKVKKTICAVYENRTGLDADVISAMMDAETWMTAQEAKEKGFCDYIIDEEATVTDLTHSKFTNSFKHIPDSIKNISKNNELVNLVNNLENRVRYLEQQIEELKQQNNKELEKEGSQNQDKELSDNMWSSFFGIKKIRGEENGY